MIGVPEIGTMMTFSITDVHKEDKVCINILNMVARFCHSKK